MCNAVLYSFNIDKYMQWIDLKKANKMLLVQYSYFVLNLILAYHLMNLFKDEA